MSVLALAALAAQHVGGDYAQGGWHMHDWDHMMDYPHGGILMWIIFLALVVLAIVLIVQSTRGRAPSGPVSGPAPETAIDILKKRYAKGEITKDEFDRMKEDLQK